MQRRLPRLPTRRGLLSSQGRTQRPRRLRKRLPLRGAGAERLRGVTAPMASRRVSACARGASAPPPSGRHTSPSRFACHLPSRGGLGVRRLRGKAPLEGSWRGAPERCYRTNGFPQSFGVCKGRFRAAALRAAHLSVTLRVPPPLEGRLKGASPEKKAPLEGSWRGAPERCYRTNGFPQSFGVCKGRFRAAALRAAHLSVTLRVPPGCH